MSFPYQKTLFIPSDNGMFAQKTFQEALEKLDQVLLVVLDTTSEAEQTAILANKMAGEMDEPRWVIWVRRPDQIQEHLDQLSDPQSLINDWDSVLAFSLSRADREIRFVIPTGNGPATNVQMFDAYNKASTTQA